MLCFKLTCWHVMIVLDFSKGASKVNGHKWLIDHISPVGFAFTLDQTSINMVLRSDFVGEA